MEFKEALDAAIQPLVPHHSGVPPQYKTAPLLQIFHPFYSNKFKPLMQFLALDSGGIDYDLAYYACCLLVGNAWTRPEALQPYFSLTRKYDESKRIIRPDNGILPANKYYFHDPQYASDQGPYPIIPSFAHWSFPHGNLPLPWRNLPIAEYNTSTNTTTPSSAREATIQRDQCCRITQAICGVEKAHIIPSAEDPWFTSNDMGRYVSVLDTPNPIDDLRNAFLLRVDVHRIFDLKGFLIFPKLRDGRRVLVTHVLHSLPRTLHEMDALFHNRLCHQLYGVAPEFLFARFAWAILDSTTVQLFETTKPDQQIAVRIREDAPNSEPTSRVIYVTSGDQVPPTTSTTATSPSKKRSRSSASRARQGSHIGKRREEADSDTDVSVDEAFEDFTRSHIGKRREEADSDTDVSVDEAFEDFSRPLKRGRPLARPSTPPLPVSMTESLGTLPGSSRSNSSTATHNDTAADSKISGYNHSTGEIVPIKHLD
ncbi:hypothetical protein F5Y06DRAFT_19597 [Hypoxylon sp. FL0890]|nr:hypothetical protein F5Y06DRAFT_19597 [Hypoxylon sp. FL0890]